MLARIKGSPLRGEAVARVGAAPLGAVLHDCLSLLPLSRGLEVDRLQCRDSSRAFS